MAVDRGRICSLSSSTNHSQPASRNEPVDERVGGRVLVGEVAEPERREAAVERAGRQATLAGQRRDGISGGLVDVRLGHRGPAQLVERVVALDDDVLAGTGVELDAEADDAALEDRVRRPVGDVDLQHVPDADVDPLGVEPITRRTGAEGEPGVGGHPDAPADADVDEAGVDLARQIGAIGADLDDQRDELGVRHQRRSGIDSSRPGVRSNGSAMPLSTAMSRHFVESPKYRAAMRSSVSPTCT